MGMEVFYMDLGKIFFIDSALHFLVLHLLFSLMEKVNIVYQKKIDTPQLHLKITPLL